MLHCVELYVTTLIVYLLAVPNMLTMQSIKLLHIVCCIRQVAH